MSTNTQLDETLQAWADIVIRNWEEKIHRLKVYDSYQLLNSFTQHVVLNANGNPERVEFTFNYYGKFADMGVGNGVSLEYIGSGKRRPKQWYSKTFFAEVKKLGELLAEKYALKAALVIVNGVEGNSIKE